MTDPTVVLVSVGADSAALIDEIEKKGLRVVSCPFADAEEAIEREKPLLVVLHGARGAVELSTMLEEAKDAPQVAVVAARAELGTLMGLNRDIVVSLLATELTEKTVAARLEAVVRQRAKTLGLTLNLAARRMSLGPRPSLPRPPGRPSGESKPNFVLEAPTPDVLSAGRAPAPKPPSSVSQAIPAAPRMPGGTGTGTSIGLPTPGRPDPAPSVPVRPPPHPPIEPFALDSLSSQLSPSVLLSDVPEPAKPPAMPPRVGQAPAGPPPRPAPPRPAGAPSLDAVQAAESNAPPAMESLTPSVIESLAPQDEGEAPPMVAPAAPPVPRFDPGDLLADSGLKDSIGPDLRAALPFDSGEQELVSVALLPKAPAGEGSSSALEAHPHRPYGEAAEGLPPGLEPGDLLSATDGDDEDSLALPLLRQSRPASPDQAAEDFSSTMLTEVTMPAIPGSLAAEALAAARLRSEPNHPIPDAPFETEAHWSEQERSGQYSSGQYGSGQEHLDRSEPDPEQDRATVTGGPPESRGRLPSAALAERRTSSSTIPPQRGKGGRWAAAFVLLAALGGGVAFVKWGLFKPAAPSVKKEVDAAVADANVLPPPAVEEAAPVPTEAPSPAPTADADGTTPEDVAAPLPSAVPVPTEPSAEPEAEAEAPPPTPTAEAAPAADAPPSAAAAGLASTEPAVLLDNPFGTPDANLPGCEQLAPGARPTTGDPVAEASGHWTLARKSIVKGDIEGASRAMCLAVAINPQSPAVEGLARLYTLAHSSAHALVWVERAIQLAPANRELLNLRGDAKSQLGQQEAATIDWLEAMGIRESETKRRTNQAAAYANLAREERTRADLAKAEQFFRRALGFEETNLVALTGMAELMLGQKLYDHAGSFAVRALAVFETVPEAYLVLGEVALAKNDPARARASFERALAIRPDFWPAKTRLRELSK